MANYKRLFLAGHSYYLTVVTHRRKPLLVEHIELLRESFCESKRYYRYEIDAIVVLPDHIHMIMTPEIATDYPKIVRAIKYNFSTKLVGCDCYRSDEEQSFSRYRRGLKTVWQKRYYEHTIRDEKDYFRCLEYMQNNPVKHELVKDMKDWAYSSFV